MSSFNGDKEHLFAVTYHSTLVIWHSSTCFCIHFMPIMEKSVSHLQPHILALMFGVYMLWHMIWGSQTVSYSYNHANFTFMVSRHGSRLGPPQLLKRISQNPTLFINTNINVQYSCILSRQRRYVMFSSNICYNPIVWKFYVFVFSWGHPRTDGPYGHKNKYYI